MIDTQKIKGKMAEIGITQSEMAKKIGIATPTMCQKINNIRPVTLEEAEKMAGILGIENKDFGLYFFAH